MILVRHSRRKIRILWLRLVWKLGRRKIKVGRDTDIARGAEVDCRHGGEIDIGDRCVIHSGAKILTYGGKIKLGTNVSVNPFTILYGQGGLTIGDNVAIAAHCVVIPANHAISLSPVPMRDRPLTREGITIGSDVWIGAGVRILDGVNIGDGCVLAAGAVVTKSTEKNGIYAGIPARLLRFRQ